ncbi:MAG: chemotaxis protein CheC [Lachnospiraceae bacterium]|nr:chemotaxis protein CheC [Lachnospiraceae bacterium]
MVAYENLNDLQLDVMREIGNIGAGNACTALSVLLGTTIDMSVPRIQLLGYETTTELLGGEDNMVIGLKVEVNGDLDGMMLHVVEKRFAERIINTFYAKEIDSITNLDEMDSSVLNEMANITSGAYANSIATLTGLFVNIGTPNQVPGKVSEILKLPLNEFVKPGEKVLVVDEEFTIDDEHISSNMILALESESLEKLFSRLGVQL